MKLQVNKKIIKILRSAGAVLCAVIVILSALLTLASGFVKATLLNRDFYFELCTDEYVNELCVFIRKGLEPKLNERFGYDAEEGTELRRVVLEDCVKLENVKALSREYLGNLYDYVLGERDELTVEYGVEYFKPLEDYLNSQLEEGESINQEAMDELKAYFSSTCTAKLNPFSIDSIIGLDDALGGLYSKLSGDNPLAKVLNVSPFIYVFVAFVALVGVFVLSAPKKLWHKLYNSFGVLWCGATITFVPVVLFAMEDLPGRLLILENSPTRTLFVGMLRALIDSLVMPTAIFFGVATALLIAAIVLRFLKADKSISVSPSESLPEPCEAEKKQELPEPAEEKQEEPETSAETKTE